MNHATAAASRPRGRVELRPGCNSKPMVVALVVMWATLTKELSSGA